MAIFRQTALNRLSTPEQLDLLLEVITPKGWLALIGLWALIASAVVWSFVGSLPTRVAGIGILVKKGGLTSVNALAAGQLSEIIVTAGVAVHKGQLLARLALPELRAELESAQASLASLVSQDSQLSSFSQAGARLEKAAIAQQRRIAQNQISVLRERGELLSKKLQTQEKLLADGLITDQALQATRDTLIASHADVERAHSTLKELSVKQTEGGQSKTQEAIMRRIKIEELRRRITDLHANIERYSLVVSPVVGRVLEVRVAVGTLIKPGTPLIMLEQATEIDPTQPQAQDLEAIVYVPGTDGKKVSPGMAVEVSPSTVLREEHGAIRGSVVSVSEFPASTDAITAKLGNPELAMSFLKTLETPLELRIALTQSKKTRSGYEWTSPKGPPQKIQQGTLCRVWITTRSRTPISQVLPLLREDLGL